MPDAVVEQRARARVGTTLDGKYKLDRLLGVGGMAAVYAATHRNTKRVAVKVLHPEVALEEGIRSRFMREGYVANTVGHPGAVAVIDDHIGDDGSAYLVMELLPGETLDDTCARFGGKLPLRAVLAVADQALDVLAAAEAKGIVHRDIKPANLFLTRSGDVKVLDFGVARMRDPLGALATHTGLTMGTPAFMAPEQAMGRSEEIGARADVFAVGATMFAMLTGRAVHQASSAQEQMVFAATRPARSVGEVDPQLPSDVIVLIDKALAFEQAARWQSPAAMRGAVRRAYRALYDDDPSPKALTVFVVPEEASPTSRPDPAAPTVPLLPSEPPELRPTSRASGPNPVSLAGTAAQARTVSVSRTRMFAGASLLVGGGMLLGVWFAARPRGPSAAASALPASTSVGSVVAAPPASSASFAPSVATAPAGVPSEAPSAAALPATPATQGAPAPPARAHKPMPTSSAPGTHPLPIPSPDRFDHQ